MTNDALVNDWLFAALIQKSVLSELIVNQTTRKVHRFKFQIEWMTYLIYHKDNND